MKKAILIALAILFLASCTKERQPQTADPICKYSFMDEGVWWTLNYEHPEIRVDLTFTFFEHKGLTRIHENTVKNPEPMEVTEFKAQKEAEYVTVHVSATYTNEVTHKQSYKSLFLQTAFLLTPGQTTEIVMREHTLVGDTEPIYVK